MSNSLITDCKDGVLTITFNRPDKKNAIDNPTWIALREAFCQARDDDSIRCVLLTGAGENLVENFGFEPVWCGKLFQMKV